MEQIKQHQPDLILLDVVLPDADGYELYGTLKEADQKNAVIIFLTSKSSDEDVVRGFSVGACDYIKKPFVKAGAAVQDPRPPSSEKAEGRTGPARTGSCATAWRN